MGIIAIPIRGSRSTRGGIKGQANGLLTMQPDFRFGSDLSKQEVKP
jgi:hypothetical protein